jgi:hypothetical protein
MNSHERYKPPSWHGSDENTEVDTAKGVLFSIIAGGALWVVAIVMLGLAAGMW